ncbi:MAG: NADAR family protein, partial [Lactobacillus crispatus]|nr:NADAR family protein [Lactobacillus crispatus]MCT7709338.1 NADAR family protein [Lactobacillus crispatus]
KEINLRNHSSLHKLFYSLFDQDEFSKKALLATKKLNLIEANPNDNQWGGHCSLQDDFTKATGLNKQGKLLMEVRNTLSN